MASDHDTDKRYGPHAGHGEGLGGSVCWCGQPWPCPMAAPPHQPPPPLKCPHGQLARSCERCDDAAEIARLREELRQARARLRLYEETLVMAGPTVLAMPRGAEEPVTMPAPETLQRVLDDREDLRAQLATATAELASIDDRLARRPALEGLATRAEKVDRACVEAGKSEQYRAQLATVTAERDRLRDERCAYDSRACEQHQPRYEDLPVTTTGEATCPWCDVDVARAERDAARAANLEQFGALVRRHAQLTDLRDAARALVDAGGFLEQPIEWALKREVPIRSAEQPPAGVTLMVTTDPNGLRELNAALARVRALLGEAS